MGGKFIRLKCIDCGNEQIIFDRATTKIRCKICGATISIPTGGKAKIKGNIIEVLN